MNKKDYPFGILLIVLGILFALLNFEAITKEWLLLILSIGALVVYLMNRSVGYLVFGLILLGISLLCIFKHNGYYIFDNLW